jgi:hypothetical protein
MTDTMTHSEIVTSPVVIVGGGYGPNWVLKANPNFFGGVRFTEWEKWFAWRPVILRNEKVIWFETVYRRKVIQQYPFGSTDQNQQTDSDQYRVQYDNLLGILAGPA